MGEYYYLMGFVMPKRKTKNKPIPGSAHTPSTEKIAEAPLPKAAAKELSWLYVVKRSTAPNQVDYVMTHPSAQAYFRDSTTTEHNSATIEELDKIITGNGTSTQAELFASRIFKEAQAPTLLFERVRSRSLEALRAFYDGLKAISLRITKGPQGEDVIFLTLTIAAKDGTYEITIYLRK